MAPPTAVDPASSSVTNAWALDPQRLERLQELERKVLWLSVWMIHHANHIRPKRDGLKVGGHQASSASVATLMTALYFDVLRPSDRVAVKPHASPVYHAIQYLLGRQSREKLERFRALGGAQAYPSRTKDADDVDFSTGSVGLGVAMTSFAALVRDYFEGEGPDRRARRVGTDDRARRRRRVRRGQYLRGADRIVETRRPQRLVDHRLQPPEPRCGHHGPVLHASRQCLPRHGLARGDAEVRTAAGGSVRAPRWRCSATLDRCLSELVVLGARLQGRRRVARSTHPRSR